MDEKRLAGVLAAIVEQKLANEIAADFVKIRRDVSTGTLERSSPGKFVETFVQCLQYMATGSFMSQPAVDDYLSKRVESITALPDGLRICGARIARAIYTLRNKRNIAHKGEVDPNTFDLAFVHQGASWIVAEMLRLSSGQKMEEAGRLVELVQAPAGTLVEEIEGVRLVHAKVSVRAEILILLHSHYPDRMFSENIEKSMQGCSRSSIRNRLGELKEAKLVFGDRQGVRLTRAGFEAAVVEIAKVSEKK